jgi:predicted nucleic acid-binding protein
MDRKDVLHEVARTSVWALRAQGNRFHFLPQNAAEFWTVCTRPNSVRNGLGIFIEEAGQRLRVLHRVADVLDDHPAGYRRWRELIISARVSGTQTHDCRLAAQMIAHGISHLLTFNDKDFQRYSGITAVHPSSVVASGTTT